MCRAIFCPPASACCLIRSAAADYSNVVDIYNGITGLWSTAVLSVARDRPATASVGNVAFFAGGSTERALLCSDYVWCLCLRGDLLLIVCQRRSVALLIASSPCDHLFSHALCCRQRNQQCCRHIQQRHRGMVNCCAQCGTLCSFSCICRKRGFVRWRLHWRCVVVQRACLALMC